MEAELTNLILLLPNMAVALWALWRDDKRITGLLEQQRWLIEQLMALHPPQDENSSADVK